MKSMYHIVAVIATLLWVTSACLADGVLQDTPAPATTPGSAPAGAKSTPNGTNDRTIKYIDPAQAALNEALVKMYPNGARPQMLVGILRLDSDSPQFEFYLTSGYVLNGIINTPHYKTKIAANSKAAISLAINTYRPILFLVSPPKGTDVNDINLQHVLADGTYSSKFVNDISVTGNFKAFWDKTLRTGTVTYHIVTTVKGANGQPDKDTPVQDVTFTKASEYDLSIGLSAMYIVRWHETPAFGLTKSVYAIGSSKRFTLDAVTAFGVGSGNTNDVSLGAAISYNWLLGTTSEEGLRAVWGFPIQLNLTLGFEGLDVTHVNSSGHIFFGIGLTLPTTKK